MPDLELHGPGLVILTGASGAGKSSLLKALTGTLREFQGGHVGGHIETQPASMRIGFVPQDARDAFLAHDARTEFQLRLQAIGWRYHAAREEAMLLLRKCELDARSDTAIHRLSAGERRRLALFGARIHRPSMLLLDEPLNHLDTAWRTTIVNDVTAAAEHMLVVVATHEPGPWEPVATQRFTVADGRITHAELREPRAGPTLQRPDPPGEMRLRAQNIQDARGLLAPLDLVLGAGLHAIAGPNGSGKSTLLRILAGLDKPASGTVTFDGTDMHGTRPSALARFRAYHIEEPREAFFMEHGTNEVRFQPTNAGFPADDVDERAQAAITAFGLSTLAQRHPLSLSGGEQERLALACTHAARPDLLVLDEPTHGLDERGRDDLIRFILEKAQNACVVLATHDPTLLNVSNTVHWIDGGRLLRAVTARIAEVRPRDR